MAQVEMRDVIVDDDDPSTDDGRAPRTPGASRTAARTSDRPLAVVGRGRLPGDGTRDASRPPRPRLPIAVAGALAVLLLAAAVVEVGTERARAARLDATAGLLATLEPGSVDERWRQPAGRRATLGFTGGLVLHTSPTRQTLVALDALTGGTRWEVPLPDGAVDPATVCDTVPERGAAEGDDGVARYVGCRVLVAQHRGVGLPTALGARLMVLDARTGQTLRERPLANRYATLSALGADLVVVDVPGDGHVVVTREDAATGRVGWSFRSRYALPNGGSSSGPGAPWIDVQHGRLVADGPVAWVLDGDGAALGEWRPPGSRPAVDPRQTVEVTVLPDGAFAVGHWDLTSEEGQPFGTVSRPDGGDGYALPGPVLRPVVDDGTAADVVLTLPTSGRRRIVALDAATGDERWTLRTGIGGQAVVLDGRLVLNTGSDVMAVDVRTGAELWRAGTIPTHLEMLTDGHVILVPTWDRENGPILAAVDVADGRVRWSSPAPRGVMAYAVGDGRLFALSERETVGLG